MHSRLAHAACRTLACTAVGLLVLSVGAVLAARPSLRTVRLIIGEGETAVVLSADGPLPVPKVGILDNPPRIYFDFPDIRTATDGVRVKGEYLVRAVRVALNQAQPVVTRVVVDLSRPAPHRIDASQRDAGQLTIIVGVRTVPSAAATPPAAGQAVTAGTPAAPPTTPPGAPPPVPPPGRTDAPAPRAARSPDFARAAGVGAVRAPPEEVAQYLRRVSPMIERLERLRPVLLSLDALTLVPDQQLQAAGEEFGSVQRALEKVTPPGSLAATHELFRDVCVLGAASVRARLSPAEPDDAARAWNAAAAAAGTIMLLERARAEVGLPMGRSSST